MTGLIDEILKAAGAEHEARAPSGDVVPFPMVSKHLRKTAPQFKGREVSLWTARAISAAPYVSIAVLTLTALVGISVLRSVLVYAEVGRATCSGHGSWLMTETEPGERLPVLKDKVLVACDKARGWF